MGLPKINIEFKAKAQSAVSRSERGVVALILFDDGNDIVSEEYYGLDDPNFDEFAWSADNNKYIEMAFKGSPEKVIVARLDPAALGLDSALAVLGNKKFNYLAVPEIASVDVEPLVSWLKSKREEDKRTFKIVLANHDADYEGVVNLTTEDIEVEDTTYSAQQYTSRIAGVLAGMPFTRSATFYVLDEIDSIKESSQPDSDIDNGQLIIINDGEKFKIGRGVNSLSTISEGKKEDFKKIRVVEVMDMIKDDIRSTFNDHYIGKVNNTYDNQVLFFATVNDYFELLESDDILDPYFDNKATLDVDAQKAALLTSGVKVDELSEQEIKEKSFKSNVFTKANIKIVDAMEDLDFGIYVE